MISDVNEPGIHPRGVPSRMGEVVQKVVNRGGSGIVRVLSLDKGELLRIGWFGHITESASELSVRKLHQRRTPMKHA